MVRHSEKHLIIILYPSSLSNNNHVAKVWSIDQSQQVAVLKRMRNILPFEITSNIYTFSIDQRKKYWNLPFLIEEINGAVSKAWCKVFQLKIVHWATLSKNTWTSTRGTVRVYRDTRDIGKVELGDGKCEVCSILISILIQEYFWSSLIKSFTFKNY